jgi:MFS family permease
MSNGICEDILGFGVLRNLHPDSKTLIATKSLRMFSFGFLSVVLVVYLIDGVQLSLSNVGWLFSLTILGDAVVSILLTSRADTFGRRFTLMAGSLLSGFTSIVFLTQNNFYVLLFTGIIGVISPSGYEIGPFMAIELSALAEVTRVQDRTKLMAWYNLFGSFSGAFGALACGVIIDAVVNTLSTRNPEMDANSAQVFAFKVTLFIYAVIQIILGYFFFLLTPAIEVPTSTARIKEVNPVSLFLGLHKSKFIILKLSLLFILDSFAGSFVLMSIMTEWFHMKFGTSPKDLGAMVFVCNLVAGISALFAAKLADYIGLVLTMVVTHLPSNVLLMLVPLMPGEASAIAMLCARYCISHMDVPTRNAYVQGVVEPDERSAANGITNVVRSIGGAIGPVLSGMLLENPKYVSYPFIIAGGLKIVYDLLLVYSFASLKPDSEERTPLLPPK